MAECVNCGEPAVDRYTLVFQSGMTIQDEPLCRTCHELFHGGPSIEVHEAPVLVRGGEEKDG